MPPSTEAKLLNGKIYKLLSQGVSPPKCQLQQNYCLQSPLLILQGKRRHFQGPLMKSLPRLLPPFSFPYTDRENPFLSDQNSGHLKTWCFLPDYNHRRCPVIASELKRKFYKQDRATILPMSKYINR